MLSPSTLRFVFRSGERVLTVARRTGEPAGDFLIPFVENVDNGRSLRIDAALLALPMELVLASPFAAKISLAAKIFRVARGAFF